MREMKARGKNILKSVLPIAFVATMLCGIMYAAIQQVYRQSANDPQIELAQDAVPPSSTNTVDIAQSLSPYQVFYDEQGNPDSGNGLLNGSLPNLPQGVFNYTRTYGEDRFTWQPEPGVRQAVVIVHLFGGGFSMAGRSLREVEWRESQLELIVWLGWVLTIIGLFIVAFVAETM